MYRQVASILLCIGSCVLVPPATLNAQDGKDSPKREEKQQPAKGKDAVSALTGCIDEQDGAYVLVNDRTLSAIASLQAEGFPTEGFAKHVGHKVTVRGTSSSGGALPLIKVRSIETISETCAPQQP